MKILFDQRDLQTFALLAEELNFTTVAERQNTVQSAISAQLRKLEDSLGQTLVSRGRGKKVSLTPEVVAFLSYVERILSLSEEAVEVTQTANKRRILRLGTTVTLAMSIVADVLGAFAQERPDIQIQIQCDRSDGLLRRLEEGDIDVAFMMDQGRHSFRSFVYSMELNWVASPRFVRPKEGPIPLAFLTDGRDLRRYSLRALDGVGLKGQVSHLSPHPIGVRALVQAGLALTVMPAKAIGPPLAVAPDDLSLPSLPPIALAAYAAPSDHREDQEVLIELLERAISG